MRRATRVKPTEPDRAGISIHALLAESDAALSLAFAASAISIHALLAESDSRKDKHSCNSLIFLSTLSLRRATRCCQGRQRGRSYFYPRSPCGERPPRCRQHLRARRFLSTLSLRRATSKIMRLVFGLEFLSTLSLRRATQRSCERVHKLFHFYPRSPCGERRLCWCSGCRPPCHFYPRSPCGERHCHAAGGGKDYDFYPRSPCGERLNAPIRKFCKSRISIHALLAESDAAMGKPTFEIAYFYPRSPCGERRAPVDRMPSSSEFLSTLSLRRATPPVGRRLRSILFLSTLSLRRATSTLPIEVFTIADFYPRSPCGERRSASRYFSMPS